MKKRFCCIPEEREKECTHHLGWSWTGQIPCTGRQVCHLCGLTREEAEADFAATKGGGA